MRSSRFGWLRLFGAVSYRASLVPRSQGSRRDDAGRTVWEVRVWLSLPIDSGFKFGISGDVP